MLLSNVAFKCCFQIQLAPLQHGGGDVPGVAAPGKAVQVDPMKPMLKAPESARLKLKRDKLLSSFGFKFNLRHYSLERAFGVTADDEWVDWGDAVGGARCTMLATSSTT